MNRTQGDALPVRSRTTPSDLAQRYGLRLQRVKGQDEWHGPNPFENGATEDGFWINENGTACDRRLGTNGKPRFYSAAEVAELSQTPNYEPVILWRERQPDFTGGQSDLTPEEKGAKTWKERGIHEQTLNTFQVKTQKKGWEYPTFFADGSPGRKRWKNAESRGAKYKWLGTGNLPTGFNLDKLNGAKEVWIVGGEPDVMAMHQNGLIAVSTFGENQGHHQLIEELRSLGIERVRIALDNDQAGEAGTVALLKACEQMGIKATAHQFEGAKGYDVCDLLSDAQGDKQQFVERMGALSEFRSSTPQPRKQTGASGVSSLPRVYTGEELLGLKLEPLRWVVPNFIGEGVTILAGAPKIGKSWMVLEIAISVALGERAFGQWQVDQGDVLYLALEDTVRRVQDRLLRVTRSEDVRLYKHLHLTVECPPLDKGGLKWLEDEISSISNLKLIIIDTFKKVRQSRVERDYYGEDYDHISQLKALADKYAIPILLVHHTTKQDTDDPLKSVSGSMGITGAADGIIVVTRNRRNQEASVFVTGRDVEEQKLSFQWDAETFTWTFQGQSDEDSKPRLTFLEQKTLSVLDDHFGQQGATNTEWKQACGQASISVASFNRATKSLAEANLVVRDGQGKGARFRSSTIERSVLDAEIKSEHNPKSHSSSPKDEEMVRPSENWDDMDSQSLLVSEESHDTYEIFPEKDVDRTLVRHIGNVSIKQGLPVENETLRLFEDENLSENVAWH